MSNYKYINVVEDGTEKFIPSTRSSYKILEYKFNGNHCLIEAIGGVDTYEAAQLYFFANDSDRCVYVREYLPEFKYEKYKDTPYFRDPFIQARLEKEDEENRNRLEPNF